MLNFVMTHSPRLAATATNKRYGPDSETDPATKHRMAWTRLKQTPHAVTEPPAPERALRERTA